MDAVFEPLYQSKQSLRTPNSELRTFKISVMRRTSILVALSMCLLSTFSLKAQDTQEETVFGHSGMALTGFWINWHHQATSYDQSNTYLTGWMYGIEFGKAIYLGYGRSNMRDNVQWDDQPSQVFDMHFDAFRVGYAYKGYKAIHPVINVDFGTGRNTFAEVEDRVFIIQPGLGFEINALQWIRLSFEGGYRFNTGNDIKGISDSDLSGAFGQVVVRMGCSWGRHYKSPAKRWGSDWNDWDNWNDDDDDKKEKKKENDEIPKNYEKG